SILVGQMGWAAVERVWLPTWVRDQDRVVESIVESASNATTESSTGAAAGPGADDARDSRHSHAPALTSSGDEHRPADTRESDLAVSGTSRPELAMYSDLRAAATTGDRAELSWTATGPAGGAADEFVPAHAKTWSESWVLGDDSRRSRDL